MPPSRSSRFKDSRLVRTAGVYAGVSWLVLQVVDTLIDNLELPRSIFIATLILLGVGFVVVLATAWVQSRPGLSERAQAEEVPEAWEFDGSDLVRSLARGKLPHLTWARALVGGLAAFLLLFGIAGLYIVVQDRGQSFFVSSAEASAAPGVAVMPFAVSGQGVDLLREGMMDLLSTNLDGVGGLRTIHTRTVLARWREGGLDDAADLDQVLDVARATGARLALVGSAVGVGATVRVRAELYDLEGGTAVGEAQIEGPQDDILALLDQLSVDVVRRVLREEGGGAVQVQSLESLTTSSLPALRAFLEGEALYRRADFTGATEAFQRALQGDSLFALAHRRLSSTLGWNSTTMGQADTYGQRARELADRLPARDATIIRLSDRAMREGQASAVAEFRQLAEKYPDDPEVWYWLGELYNHAGEVALVPVEDMCRAGETAIALDSAFVPAYIHAIESALSFHDMATARALVAGFERYGPGVADLERMRFMVRFTQSTEGIAEALAAVSDEAVLDLAVNLNDADVGTEPMRGAVVEELLRRVDEGFAGMPIRNARHFVADARLSLGRHDAFLALLPRFDPVDRVVFRLQASFQGIDAPGDDDGLPPGGGLGPALYGALAAALAGDRAAYEVRRQELRSIPTPDGADPAGFEAAVARVTQAVEAWGLWAFDGAEAGAPALGAAHRVNGEGGSPLVSQLLALAAESAHTELGQWEDALRYARSARADAFATFRQAKLYEQLGQPDEARRLYPLVLHSLEGADPDVPEVAEARERLAALGGG
jgi:tetratricopeptide (TPR) repeat protein